MRVRLTRKFSDSINGVDLSHRHVGEVIDLPRHDAELLIAEGWALPADKSASAIGSREQVTTRAAPTPPASHLRSAASSRAL